MYDIVRCGMCAVCSKTLWIGHLNKHTTEQELSSELSQLGEVSSINVSLFLTLTSDSESLFIIYLSDL